MATTVNVEVDRGTKITLQRKAKDEKVSVSVIVRWAIQEYLERQPLHREATQPKQGEPA